MQYGRRYPVFRYGVALLSGSLLATSCTPAQVNAVLNGVSVLASALDQQDDEVTFFDWLESELED